MGAVNTTYTFTPNDTITSLKMNGIIDDTVMTADSILGNTLEVASGKLKVRSQGITASEMGVNSVTTTNISDLSVITSKLADSSVTLLKMADSSVGTSEIVDLSVIPAKLSQPFTLSTVRNATGTVVDFTSIPSWAKRITVIFNGVSTSGSSLPLIRLGDSGGIETTGYVATAQYYYSGNGIEVSTVGQPIVVLPISAATIFSGSFSILLIGSNTWIFSGNTLIEGSVVNSCAGKKALSDVLTQIRITTVGGIDSFDAGTINIMYE